MKNIPTIGVVMTLGMAQVAGAAGNTPINTPARAARSALYALDLPNALSQRVNNDDYSARVIIEHGFDLLEAATTVEALLAAPRGIVVACPYGGTLTARMTRNVPSCFARVFPFSSTHSIGSARFSLMSFASVCAS